MDETRRGKRRRAARSRKRAERLVATAQRGGMTDEPQTEKSDEKCTA